MCVVLVPSETKWWGVAEKPRATGAAQQLYLAVIRWVRVSEGSHPGTVLIRMARYIEKYIVSIAQE